MATEKEPENELGKLMAEEYHSQLFGLRATTIILSIHKKLKANMTAGCDELYTSIEKKYNLDSEGENTIKHNIEELKKAYHQNLQPHLIEIKNALNKFIVVPDNIRLEEDKIQAIQYIDEEYKNLERQLENLQQKARQVNVFHAALKEELKVAEGVEESENVARMLKKLSAIIVRAIDKSKNLTETH